MNPLLKKLLARYQVPAGEDGADTGGADTGETDVDRGDDFTPTDDEAPAAGKTTKTPAAAGGADGDDVDPDNPDADETEEEKEEKAKQAADGKTKGKDNRIPLSRHKDLLEKERAKRNDLERELAQYRQGKQIAAVNEDITKAENSILALEKEYTKLMSDGDVEKATEAMGKIRRMEREVSEQKADMKIAAAEARATETARYNITIERIEAAYPQLNEDHDDFDADVAADVLDLKAAYQARRGMTPSAALQAAVEKMLGKKGAKQEAAVDTVARVPAKDKDDDADKAEKTAERKAAAVKKVVDAVGRTPPNAATIGRDSDKLGGGMTAQQAVKMPDAEFNQLDENILARMRGDVL